MTYRVKVIPPCKDVHYFYASTLKDADRMTSELTTDLEGTGCTIFVYADTSYGHIRIR